MTSAGGVADDEVVLGRREWCLLEINFVDFACLLCLWLGPNGDQCPEHSEVQELSPSLKA